MLALPLALMPATVGKQIERVQKLFAQDGRRPSENIK
jgi:hypothetical protein